MRLPSLFSLLAAGQLAGCMHGVNAAAESCQDVPLPSETRDAAARRLRVEQNLLPTIALTGVPDSVFSLRDRMARYAVPGVTIAVVHDGRIDWTAAYGVRRAGEQQPVSPLTVFQAGSISKSIAAVTALRLVERDELSLDADVNSYLRSWQVPVDSFTSRRPVTLRQLLSHSAGLNVPSYPGYERGKPLPTLAQLLRGEPPSNTPSTRVQSLPGSEWRYSGAGNEVVRQLIEDRTGASYADVAVREVLRPAGMCRSTFSQRPDTLGLEVASGHSGGAALVGHWRLYPELAAAGMWSTSADLARFGVALGRSLRAPSGGGLLSAATLREALSVQSGNWGLGFQLHAASTDSATFGHNGSTAGFAARVVMLRDGRRGLVVMTNGESDALIDEIQRTVASVYGWPVGPREVRRVAVLPRAELEPLTGTYRILYQGRNIDVGFSIVGDRLAFAASASARPTPLYAESSSRFFARESGTTFNFERSGTAVPRVIIDQPGLRFVAERLP